MPLEIRRLLTSETWVLGTPEERCAALCLWMESWHQVPAASLPDNARMLAHLSGAGARWEKVAAHALRGWIKCEDGRLYHPVVAEKARDAWARKERQRERSRKANAARWGSTPSGTPHRIHEEGTSIPEHEHGGVLDASHKDPTRIPQGVQQGSNDDPKGQGQGQGELREGSETTSRAVAAAASPAAEPPPDARTALWTEGLGRLRRLTGKPDRPARALLGQFCRAAGDDCALVASLLHEAEAARIGDPIPWLQAAIRTRTGAREPARKPTALSQWADLMQPAETAFDFDAEAEEIRH
jgi:hypothetical protein